MDFFKSLTPSELSSLCLVIAAIAMFLAVILTVIHYMTGLVAGFAAGVAAGTHGYWPMMQEWGRDVMIPLVISAGSMLLWGGAQLYERFMESGAGEALKRF